MTTISTPRLLWGLFCAAAGAALAVWLTLERGPIAAALFGVLGLLGGVVVAFNPIEALLAAVRALGKGLS